MGRPGAEWWVAAVALIAGFGLVVRGRRRASSGAALAGVGFLVLALGMAVDGWVGWPKRTAERFVERAAQRDLAGVNALLATPPWEATSAAGWLVVDGRGLRAEVAAAALPLAAANEDARTLLPVALLSGTHEFALAPAGTRAPWIRLRAERGRVVCVEVDDTAR